MTLFGKNAETNILSDTAACHRPEYLNYRGHSSKSPKSRTAEMVREDITCMLLRGRW